LIIVDTGDLEVAFQGVTAGYSAGNVIMCSVESAVMVCVGASKGKITASGDVATGIVGVVQDCDG
jgi:hypothetical protein